MRRLANWFGFLLSAAVVMGLPLRSLADTYIWDGGTLVDNNWSSVTNWSADAAPVSASNTTVQMAGTVQTESMQDIADPFVLNRLDLLNINTSLNPGFIVRGSQLKFVADQATQPRIFADRKGGNYIYNDIEIPANTTLEMQFTTYGVRFYGVISGEGGIDKLQNHGGIDGLYNSANSFSGGLTIRAVDNNWYKVNVHASGAMGTGPVNLYGGTLGTVFSSPGGLIFYSTTVHANQVNLFKNSPVFADLPNGGADVTLNGDFDLNSFSIWLRGGGAGEIGGVISEGGSDAINKVDSGTWTLSGANTFTGRVTVSDGTLALAASDALDPQVPVTVEGGTYDLGGFSVINGAVEISAGTIKNGTLVGSSYTATDEGCVSATLGGSGGLDKSGSGTLTLRGTHAFTGPLTVVEGAVEVEVKPAPGSALWLDASSLDSLARNTDGSGGQPSHGNTVGYWSSLSGDMWVSGDSKPAYHTNVVNGLPALYFNYHTLNFSTNITAQESTAFIVYRYDNPIGHWRNPIDSVGQTPSEGWLHMINNLNNRSLVKGGGAVNINSPHSATNWAVQAVQLHSGDYRLWVNEDAYGPQTSTAEFTPFTTVSSGSIVGYYCEILIYTNSLSSADKINTIRYLRRKWLDEGELPAVSNQLATQMAEVKDGALLDLSGGIQDLFSLKGSGTVTNGTVIIAGALTPGDTGASAATLEIGGNLTLSTGATSSFDYVSATSDTVAVSGTLTVESANIVDVSLNGQLPPSQMTLFTFGSITGEENLASWTVTGEGLAGYSTRIQRVDNTLVMTASPAGSLIVIR